MVCGLLASPLLVERSWFADWRHRLAGVVVAVLCAAPLLPFALGQQQRSRTSAGPTPPSGSTRPRGRAWPGRQRLRRVRVLVRLGLPARRGTTAAGGPLPVRSGRRRHDRRARAAPRIGGWHPYGLLVDHVSAFSHLRSPFRATVLAQLGLAVLAGLGIDALWSSRDRTIGPAVVGDREGARTVTAESGRSARGSPDPETPLDQVARRAPGRRGGGAAARRRSRGGGLRGDDRRDGPVARDGHPLLNGYSGFFPDRDEGLRARLETFEARWSTSSATSAPTTRWPIRPGGPPSGRPPPARSASASCSKDTSGRAGRPAPGLTVGHHQDW